MPFITLVILRLLSKIGNVASDMRGFSYYNFVFIGYYNEIIFTRICFWLSCRLR